jgi:hypothetical protein
VTETAEHAAANCANCDSELHGEFCSRCGQHTRDLHRPVGVLLSQVSEDLLSLDTRFFRTIPPLLLKPGEVTRRYRAGHRVGFVPPLRTYLIAALVFFGVFTFFAEEPTVTVVTTGSPEAEALNAARKKGESGAGVAFELPAHSRVFGRPYNVAIARAKADPQAFGRAFYGNIPRTIFVLLPVFALLLELFYRTSGYYVEHLVFSLYYHAFVFSWFTLIMLVDEGNDWLPASLRLASGLVMTTWLFAYLPLALRRVYGGTWPKTLLKVFGLGILYMIVLLAAMIAAMFVALARF